ncbi:MAG: hypothetical protein R2712_21710 [Vicinamibacterales bacterium]
MRVPASLVAIVVALSGAAWSQPGSIQWLILLDDMQLRFIETGRLRDVMRAINRDLVRPGDRCVVRCSGPSCTAGTDAPMMCEEFGDWRRAFGNGLTEEDQLLARTEHRPRELIYRADLALTAADGLLREASDGVPGIMLYVSDGYLVEAAASERLSSLAEAPAAKGVRVFPIRFKRVDYNPRRNPTITAEPWAALMTETLGSLGSLAEVTGGVIVTDPLEGGLARIKDRVQ